jgi:hypothetical protein
MYCLHVLCVPVCGARGMERQQHTSPMIMPYHLGYASAVVAAKGGGCTANCWYCWLSRPTGRCLRRAITSPVFSYTAPPPPRSTHTGGSSGGSGGGGSGPSGGSGSSGSSGGGSGPWYTSTTNLLGLLLGVTLAVPIFKALTRGDAEKVGGWVGCWVGGWGAERWAAFILYYQACVGGDAG